MTKTNRIITEILGVSMFMFGMLKFVNPFKSWYYTQVIMSALPYTTLSFWGGQLGEILVGISLLYSLFFSTKVSKNLLNRIFVLSNLGVIAIMLVAFYVHLHPNVPANVLPLKISPPIIPGVFVCLAVLNMYLKKKLKNGS